MNLLAPFPASFRYLSDMRPENCLFAAVLRSPHPHARIISIDTVPARAMPGVAAVMTAADVPGRLRFGLRIQDQPILCVGKVRTVGDPVAAVAASTQAQALAACAAIKVIYELLPLVTDPERALEPGVPAVH
jgi:CO/xanthine dehydrogenase Mo-binding subunit